MVDMSKWRGSRGAKRVERIKMVKGGLKAHIKMEH